MENLRPSSKDVDKGIINELCDWLLEIRSLDEAVEGALHMEPFRNKEERGNAFEEPDWGTRLEYLRESARLHLVSPFLNKHSTSQEKANARLMLPSFFDSIFFLLVKTWHLAQAREQHVQQLRGGLIESVELCRQAEAGPDRAELDSMRKALKEKCWELARAQKDVEKAESQRQRVEQLLIEVEQDRRCETRTRTEAERRLASTQAKAAVEAKQRTDEFHSRLMEARDALKQAQEALADARTDLQRAEQRRMQGEERAVQLEKSLTAFKLQLRALLLQQRINGTTSPPTNSVTMDRVRPRSLSYSSPRRLSYPVLGGASRQFRGSHHGS